MNVISTAFEQLTASQLPALNQALSGAGLHALTVPPLTALEDDEGTAHGSGGPAAGHFDPDASREVELPKNLRLRN